MPFPDTLPHGLPEAAGQPDMSKVFADEGHPAGGIEVHSGDDLLSAAEEQAVILHANGASQEAVPVLQAELNAIRGQQRQETWLMLFELHQQLGDQAAHEALGLEYVVEFEKTPPIWHASRAHQARCDQVVGNTCTLAAVLTAATVDNALLGLRRAVEQPDTMRLDFSRVREIDALAAAEILAIWHGSRKIAAPCQVLGSNTFAGVLSEKIKTGRRIPAEAPFWLLLMELHQASGQLEAFENLAVEYAITFEVSPPSWDARLAPKKEIPEAAVAVMPVSEILHEGFCPQGNITSAQPSVLAEIRHHAQKSVATLVLDFDAVDCIDFESAGLLLNLFLEMLQSGRSIRIIHVNELVFALLQLMGIAEFASIERRKS